ncbi:hypothetical protein HMPREF0293_1787 [Corynebacterium glucuronolyticum ATCC 51866]|uniref:Uncharacterized protein n=1 Tax=Corynebacterium glucuronolyticum ATCC 51866 TaxID=548478 RepID=A0ABP2DRN1_9CORY|nr:hypothetical protein HMPREF0293_1787 [Corynebacterium glucuronolyticum ATCC 51866]
MNSFRRHFLPFNTVAESAGLALYRIPKCTSTLVARRHFDLDAQSVPYPT